MTETAGTLTVSDGKVWLPERFVDLERYVVRTPATTGHWRSGATGIEWAIWTPPEECEQLENPSLAPDLVSLKAYGEQPIVYHVEEVER